MLRCCLIGAITLALNISSVRAADEVVLFDKKTDAALADQIAVMVSNAAHSTGKTPMLLGYTVSRPKENRVVLDLNLVYYGGITKVKYPATASVKIDTSANMIEVLEIEFKDEKNNIPPSKTKLDGLRGSLAAKISEAKPKK